MAIVGRAEVEIVANTARFEKEIAARVNAALAAAGLGPGGGLPIPGGGRPGGGGGDTEASLRSFTQLHIRALAENEAFNAELARSGTLLGRFDRAMDSADNQLKGFGLSLRDISPAARAAGAALVAVGIAKFGAAAVKAAGDLGEAQNLVEVTFGESSKAVQEFAENTATSLGLSETAALKAAGAFGAIAEAAGLTDESSAKFGVTLARIAADLGSLRNIPVEEALQKLQSGLVGQTEVLRQLGIIVDEDTLKRAAMREGIIETSRELTQQEKILATYAEILRQSGSAQGDFANTIDSLPNQLKVLDAQFEDLKATIGTGIIPVVSEVVGLFSDLAFIVDRAITGIKDLTGFVDLGEFNLLDLLPGGAARHALGRLADALGKDKEEKQENAEVTDLLAGRQEDLTATTEKAAKAAEELAEAESKVTDGRLKLNRALGDAERRVDSAERSLARAFEDSALRVDEAERALAEAFEDRSERIADAESRLTEERLQGFRQVRAARERLAEFERVSARRVADAEQEILDLRREQARAIVSSLLDVQAAQIAGDAEAENRARRELAEAADSTDIIRAKQDLKKEEADQERELNLLRRNLAEEEQDRIRSIKDAQLDLARVIEDSAERIEDAERGIAEAHRASARSVEDAQRGLTDAMRESEESVFDAIKAFDKELDALERKRTAYQLVNKALEEMIESQKELNLLTDPGNTMNRPDGIIEMSGLEAPAPIAPSGTDRFGRSPNDPNFGADKATVVNNFFTGSVDERVLANEINYRMAQQVNA